MKKKFLALLLAALMVVSLLPTMAFADGPVTTKIMTAAEGGTYTGLDLIGEGDAVYGEDYTVEMKSPDNYSINIDTSGWTLSGTVESAFSGKYLDVIFKNEEAELYTSIIGDINPNGSILSINSQISNDFTITVRTENELLLDEFLITSYKKATLILDTQKPVTVGNFAVMGMSGADINGPGTINADEATFMVMSGEATLNNVEINVEHGEEADDYGTVAINQVGALKLTNGSKLVAVSSTPEDDGDLSAGCEFMGGSLTVDETSEYFISGLDTAVISDETDFISDYTGWKCSADVVSYANKSQVANDADEAFDGEETYQVKVAGGDPAVIAKTLYKAGTGTEPESDCTYTKPVKLTAGTFGMKLGGCDKGEFTFEASGKNWNIKEAKEDGKYLNAANGKLVLGDTAATAWTYKNGAFSVTEKTTQKNNGYWLGFIYIPGRGSKTVTTTYYLSTVNNGAKLSTYYVGAELYTTVTDEHDFGCWIDCKDGTHKHICKNCGKPETKDCVYDETTHRCVCGAYDPDEVNVKISVTDVKEKTSRQYVGFFPFGYYKNVKTYTATIKTEAAGVKVTKVQYQLNGSSKWITGSSVCSDKPIVTLNIRALGSDGKWYTGEYPEASCDINLAEYTMAYKVVALGTSEDYGNFAALAFCEYEDGQWIVDYEVALTPFSVLRNILPNPETLKLGDCLHMNENDECILCSSPEAHDIDIATFTVVEGDKEAYYYCVPDGAAYSIEDGELSVKTYGEDLPLGEAGYTWKLNGNDAPASGTIEDGDAFVATFMTVGDVLATAESFPTDAASGWVNANGKKAYKEDNVSLWFGNSPLSLRKSVSPVEGGYTCTDGEGTSGITYTFNMNGNALESIDVALGIMYMDRTWGGTYAPAAPAGEISTVADVIGTLGSIQISRDFPWGKGEGTAEMVAEPGAFLLVYDGPEDSVVFTAEVTASGNNWTCNGTYGTFTFNMQDGSLKSITYTSLTYTEMSGTYEPGPQ